MFSSSAIAIVNAFFDSHVDYRDSDKMRVKFAQDALQYCRFAYFKAEGDNHRVCILVVSVLSLTITSEIPRPLLGPICRPNVRRAF